jgi:predicted AAA+ superfamily ATPase
MQLARNISKIIDKTTKSLLILGPRQTGKSTLIANLSPDLTINLADEVEYLNFASRPEALRRRLKAKKPRTIFIDEVQRIPSLLNTVQALIDDDKGLRFLLTGSSARKLRRGHANLLPGRIISLELGPLTSGELNYEIDTDLAMACGTLPGIYLEPSQFDREKILETYAATYVKEEIQAESLTRNLEGFSRLLLVVASRVTEFLDFSKLASDAAVSRQSATRYIEILEDTLIVRRAFAFAKSSRRRLIQHPRLFFFDNGVLNGLLGSFAVSADRRGLLFENLLYSQLLASMQASGRSGRISSYRTENGSEVDFIVELGSALWAIEAKASTNVGANDIRGLNGFAAYYGKPHRAVVAYLGSAPQKVGSVDVLPWQELLRQFDEG